MFLTTIRVVLFVPYGEYNKAVVLSSASTGWSNQTTAIAIRTLLEEVDTQPAARHDDEQ